MKAMAAMAFAALLTSGIAACSSDDDVVEEPAPLTANKPMLGDDMTKDEFMYNWENCQTVKIAGIQDEVNCPWYGASAQNIPDYVRFDIKKENGWEMAFCELNDPNAMRTRMFGLYNKYTGILRIFHYIDNPTGYGSELVYLVSANESVDNNKYPLYHSMEFAVPANHQYGKTLVPKTKMSVGKCQQEVFTSYVAPYAKKDTRGVTVNWHCFDLDLSCYTTIGTDWREGMAQQGHLTIFPVTSTTSNVTLTGSLIGSMSGTFTDYEVIETGGGNSMSGVCSTLNTISSILGGSVTSANILFSLMNTNNVPKGIKGAAPVFSIGGMAVNIASAIIGWCGDDEPVQREVIPGKIDLGLDATINLSGVISGYTSNGEGGVSMTPELIRKGNTEGDLGKGCWSLADDPVVYISKEDLLSSNDHINYGVKGNTYDNSEFYDYDVRLVSFFDPASVKVNLNTNLYHNIHDVVVTTNYGVYTDRQLGYSDQFRHFLMLDDRPTFSINGGETSGVVRLNKNTVPHIHQVGINDILIDDYEKPGDKTSKPKNFEYLDVDVCNYINLPGSNINVYGRQLDIMGKKAVMVPQVFVPFVKNGAISNPLTPDFVVTVNVSFKCDEGSMMFSNTFIPKVKLIGHNDLSYWYSQLKQYYNVCIQGQSVGRLANDSNIKVYDKHSQMFLSRTIKMLEKIK